MSETLVIRLRAPEEAPASWQIVDANGARSGQVQSGPVADALNVAQGRRVVVLLPGTRSRSPSPSFRCAAVRGSPRPSRLRSKNNSRRTSRRSISRSAPGMRARWERRLPCGSRPPRSLARHLRDGGHPTRCRLCGFCRGACLTERLHPAARRRNPVRASGRCPALRARCQPPCGRARSRPREPSDAGEHVTFYASQADYERHAKSSKACEPARRPCR